RRPADEAPRSGEPAPDSFRFHGRPRVGLPVAGGDTVHNAPDDCRASATVAAAQAGKEGRGAPDEESRETAGMKRSLIGICLFAVAAFAVWGAVTAQEEQPAQPEGIPYARVESALPYLSSGVPELRVKS